MDLTWSGRAGTALAAAVWKIVAVGPEPEPTAVAKQRLVIKALVQSACVDAIFVC